MAKKTASNKNDPATLAFSAVENALKGSILSTDSEPANATKANPASTRSNGSDRNRAANRIAKQTGSVANDDTLAPSKLLYDLNKKPSQAPIWIATILSIVWLAITGYATFSGFSDQLAEGESLSSLVSTLDLTSIVAVMLLPVLGFFAVAILARRAQDLRIAANSMTRAAIRLAEPETTAADKIATVGQAVRREVTTLADGLERALSRAGELEVMIHNEVTVLDKTYSENESRMRGLIQELASQRDSVITNSERVREAISESHSGLVFDLDMIAQRIAGTIEERGGELTRSMNTASENLQQAFGERSDSFISLVDGRTTGLLSALDDSAGRLNLALEDRTSSISNAFEERTHELASVIDMRMNAITEALDTRAVSLNESIEERTASISSVLRDGGGKILSDLRDRGHEVGGALDAIGLRVANEISGRAGEAEVTMTQLTNQMDEMVSTQINAMESRMQSAMLEISGSVDETSEQARLSLLGAGAQTLAQFDARVEEVAVVIDSKLKTFDDVIGQKGERLTSALDGYTTSFASRANVLELALDEKTGHFNDQISQRTREMAETISGRAGQIAETLETGNITIAGTLDSGRQHLTATLDGTADQISSAIGTRTQELASTIDRHGTEARDKIDSSLQHVTESMDTRTTEVANLINSKVAEVNDSLGRGIDNAISRINDAETGISARVEEAASTVNKSAALTADLIEAGVNSARTAITDMVDERLGTLPEAITARADITADRLASLNESINTTMGQTMTELETSADRIETSIGSTMGQTMGELEASAGRAEELIRTSMGQTMGDIEASAGRAEELLRTSMGQTTGELEAGASRAEELIRTSMGQTMGDIEASATRIEETINTRIVAASSGMSLDIEQSATRMDSSVRAAMEKIAEVAGKFETLVRVDASQSAEALGQQVENISRTIAEHTGQFSALITQKSSELEGSLQSHGNILNEALQANAHEAQAIMSRTTTAMTTDVTGALDKLNESNGLLQRVLETSTHNLATLENNIASQTATYSETVRDALGSTEQAGKLVSEHVGAMQTTIRSMIEEFGSMVGKLDGETGNIDRAAQNLSQASNASLEAVESRREAMDALAAGFTARADDIDGRLRTFAQSIADTVNDTERRLVVARKAMDDALTSTTDMVTDRLGDLAQTAGVEGERTSAALNQTQEAMLAEMQQALADATRRFNETAQAMQETARQVGTELESTRSELQRGFLELPEETRASAAAMRSVVAEQIEALNELNAIVHAQPASHDVSQASLAPVPPRTVAPKPIPPAAPPIAPPVPARQPAPAPIATSPASAASIIDTLTRPSPVSAPLASPQPTKTVAPPAKEGGGWLRDVLRNASTASQGTSAETSARTNPLTSLTADIARSIDEKALAEAWQRYQAGETGVFSRRIYTLTGQGTYDEVRKKLQRDSEFAQTTQDYVAEFEQLLQTARDVNEARQMLVSDRGKVFTMLAHASGRIS